MTTTTTTSSLKIADIIPNPEQPRQYFDKEELERLAESIKNDGLRKPIDVRPIGNNGKYELIDGERRYRAHKLLNRSEIEARILTDVKSRNEAVKQSVLLNEFYTAHTSQETERAIYRLIHEAGMSVREVARAIGKKSPGSVEAYLKAYKFRQEKLPIAMANSPKLTTSILKHTDTIKDSKLRTRIIQMLIDRTVKQEDVKQVVEVLESLPPEAQARVLKDEITLETAVEIEKEKASLGEEEEVLLSDPDELPKRDDPLDDVRYLRFMRTQDCLIKLHGLLQIGRRSFVSKEEDDTMTIEQRQQMWIDTLKFQQDDEFTDVKAQLKRLEDYADHIGEELRKVILPIVRNEIKEREQNLE